MIMEADDVDDVDDAADRQKGEEWNEMVKGFIALIANLDLEVSQEDGMMAMQMSRAIAQQMSTWGTHPSTLDHTLIPLLKAAMERYAPE